MAVAAALDPVLIALQADFTTVNAKLPDVIGEVVRDGSKRFRPRAPVTEWLRSAVNKSYTPMAFAEAARKVGVPPRVDEDVTRILARVSALTTDATASEAGGAAGNRDAPTSALAALARQLPSMEAARQRGLTLNRLNYFVGSTNMDSGLQSVRLWSDKEVSEGSVLLMASTRGRMIHDDQLFGRNIDIETKAAAARALASLERFPPRDIEALQRFYASPPGRAYAAWIGAVLVRAHDDAGAAMVRKFDGDIRSHPKVQIGGGT